MVPCRNSAGDGEHAEHQREDRGRRRGGEDRPRPPPPSRAEGPPACPATSTVATTLTSGEDQGAGQQPPDHPGGEDLAPARPAPGWSPQHRSGGRRPPTRSRKTCSRSGCSGTSRWSGHARPGGSRTHDGRVGDRRRPAARPAPVRSQPQADGRPARRPAGRRLAPGPARVGRPRRAARPAAALRTSRPRSMITTSSALCATSASWWLETSTVRPCVGVASRRKSRSQAMPSGSRPLAGSSSSSTCGSPRSAVARPSRWRMPREKPPTRRSAASARPTCARRCVDPFGRATGRPAGRRPRRWPPGGPSGVEAPGLDRGTDHPAGVGQGGRRGRRRPSRSPASGVTRPTSIRRVVVLPAPLGPRKPVTRPGRTEKDRPSTARHVAELLGQPVDPTVGPVDRARPSRAPPASRPSRVARTSAPSVGRW